MARYLIDTDVMVDVSRGNAAAPPWLFAMDERRCSVDKLNSPIGRKKQGKTAVADTGLSMNFPNKTARAHPPGCPAQVCCVSTLRLKKLEARVGIGTMCSVDSKEVVCRYLRFARFAGFGKSLYKTMYGPVVSSKHLLVREPQNRDAPGVGEQVVALAVLIPVVVGPSISMMPPISMMRFWSGR